LTLNFAAGIVVIGLIALVAMPDLALSFVIFVSGLTIIGSQTGTNAACGKLYPARMRTTGIGWGLGMGRLGGIVAPALGGFLLAHGVDGAPAHLLVRLPLRADRGGSNRPPCAARPPSRARPRPGPRVADRRLRPRGRSPQRGMGGSAASVEKR
jgi:hypothetical protein